MEPSTSMDQGPSSKSHCERKRMEPSTSEDYGNSFKLHCGQGRTGLPKWNPKHKIFLSHSGEQKEFVRQLCKDLEAETHHPFFDERSSSLMMGERFAPLIFEATRHCLVAIVVVSKAFLTSKWPMLELVEFVKAKKSHNPKLRLFPLFYKLSPNDLKHESIESRWKDAWAKIITLAQDQVMPHDDSYTQLSLDLCVEAVSELRGINGLKLDNFASKVEFREAIVKEISKLVAPDLLEDISDIIGYQRICKILDGMFVGDTIEDSDLYGTYKLGLYGMGGLGKTTMSRALCVFYYEHFNGRVFHVELGSRPPLDLQKLVLARLLRINRDVVEKIHTVHEGRHLLKEHMNRQPVFLVIDNITNNHDSQMEASAYLKAGFHVKSKIMITSRSLDIVEEFFPSYSNVKFCNAMINLNEEEARLIFLQRAIPQRKLGTLTFKEQEILKECLDQCHFSSTNGKSQYHPLALQAMADFYHKHDHLNVLNWNGHLGDLDKLRLSNTSSYIFGVLGLQFKTLTLKERLMFLDLCLYTNFQYLSEGRWIYTKKPRHISKDHWTYPNKPLYISEDRWIYTNEVNEPQYNSKDVLRWLGDIHEDTPTIVKFQLQSLKRSGIINMSTLDTQEPCITIHDLYKEFAKWYVVDGEGSHWYVYYTMPTSSRPQGKELGCVSHRVSIDPLPSILKKTNPLAYQVQRVQIGNLKCTTFLSKKIQEWCNVVVLQIHECFNLKVLDLHRLSCLRHLELVELPELESFHFIEVQTQSMMEYNDGLQSLQHVMLRGLKSLKQLPDFNMCPLLKTFQMLNCEEFLLEPPQIMGCSQLEDLNVDWNGEWQVDEFKLNTLTSLTSLPICNHGATTNWSKRLIFKNLGFLTFWGLGNCSQLKKLKLIGLPIISLQGLQKLIKLQVLIIHHCKFLHYIPDLSTLPKLSHMTLILGHNHQVPEERLLQLRYLGCLVLKERTIIRDNSVKYKRVGLVSSKQL